jgi:hypothetical protein
MPPKKSGNNGTRKDSAPTIQPKPIELETDVQDCPETAKPANTTSSANNPKASSIDGKNLLDIIGDDEHIPFITAENNLFCVLHELQELHDKAYKTNAAVITMDRNMFVKIATNTQQAWERVRKPKEGYEESRILKSIRHIQTSIADLEQKHEDIHAKVAENNAEIAHKLNEIQAIMT